MNSMAWLALLVWVGVPLLALLFGVLLWRRSKTPLGEVFTVVAIFAILSAPMLVSNGVKAYYDQQVREMCAKDGGVRVYETVRLSAEKFNEWRQVRIPSKQNAKLGDEYFYGAISNQLRNGNLEIWQYKYKVYRRVDNKLLGESLGYARGGGDLPGPWHESSFGCPGNTDITDLNKLIFVKN